MGAVRLRRTKFGPIRRDADVAGQRPGPWSGRRDSNPRPPPWQGSWACPVPSVSGRPCRSRGSKRRDDQTRTAANRPGSVNIGREIGRTHSGDLTRNLAWRASSCPFPCSLARSALHGDAGFAVRDRGQNVRITPTYCSRHVRRTAGPLALSELAAAVEAAKGRSLLFDSRGEIATPDPGSDV